MTHSRRWVIILGIVLVVAGVGSVIFWRIQASAAAAARPTLAQAEINQKVLELDARLRAIRESLYDLGPEGAPNMQRALIEEAVTRQNELMRLRPSADGEDAIRLHEWQTKLDDLNAESWNRESRALEEQAQQLASQKKMAEAVQNLKEALRLQRQINASSARQTAKNYSRESRLQQEAERMEAEPLLEEVRLATEAARKAVAAGEWTAAVSAFERARATQQKLNEDYPRTRFANTLAVERIDAELATLGATEAHEALLGLLKQARAAAEAGRDEEIDALLDQAVARQKTINEQFAKSRFVSMERFDEIEVERQTLHARGPLREVGELDRQATEHLRRRELFQAQKLITEALQKIETTARQYPKATGVDEALKQRLSYLNLRQAELVQIQDQLYDLLAPLPGNGRVAFLKTEVPQALFLRVMNSNPSRNAGRQLPVDSVTWSEAEEFCRRLGWVLGATVRLPTQVEFVAATGPVKAALAHAWTAGNSAGRTQPAGQKPANAAGFHDLLGNVAEWLADNTEEKAVLAGGSYTDDFAGVEAVPTKSAVKAERVRTQGFRVVVEIDLAAPGAK